MNPKKLSSKTSSMKEELRALRAERPDGAAVDRAVQRVLAFTPSAPRPQPVLRRAIPAIAALGGLALLAIVTSPRAGAASLQSIAEAVQAQPRRHTVTYRPDARGRWIPRIEDWVDGLRSRSVEPEPTGGRTVLGSDGRLMYRIEPNGTGFIDEGALGSPIESVDSYLRIPGARLLQVRSAGGGDIYRVDCRTVVFDLFVDPASRLPLRRDVFTESGRPIERNVYDYPARYPDGFFRAPSGPSITDYPALRRQLATRLDAPGQTKTLAGVTISLKAVLVSRTRLLALWTGGAKGEGQGGENVSIEGIPKPLFGARPTPFVVPTDSPDDEGTLRGDGAWYLAIPKGPFTLCVPVWKEDRSRPIVGRNGMRLGYHSRFVGRLSFRVTDPIAASGPDRVVWKPDSTPRTTESAK